MRLIIAGSRDLNLKFPLTVADFVAYFLKDNRPDEIVWGGATGVDQAGKDYADQRGIPVTPFTISKEDWYRIGKSAGPLRNKKMAKHGDALLLIWDGESRGSSNMKEEMLKLGKPVYEVILKIYNEKSKG